MKTLGCLIRPFPDKMFNSIIEVTVFNFWLEQIRLHLHYAANMFDIQSGHSQIYEVFRSVR